MMITLSGFGEKNAGQSLMLKQAAGQQTYLASRLIN